ncbi:MAG: YciI family protein [Candidatus Limnocylindrales bacterium]
MQYVLLIYTQEATEEPSPEAIAAEMEGYNAFGRHLAERRAMKAGEALHPSTTATTVRVRDGQTVSTDGPFAETKEVLGGFYLVEAADLDEAIGYAAMIPGAKHGSIEIRPIVDFGGEGSGMGDPAAATLAG